VDFDSAVHSTKHQNSGWSASFQQIRGFDLGLDRPLSVLVVSAVPEKCAWLRRLLVFVWKLVHVASGNIVYT
jgi:hypothetical protein